VLIPIVYRADGSVRLTAVSPTDTVQAVVNVIPASMGVDVRTVGEFALGRLDPRLELTQRQLNAVSAGRLVSLLQRTASGDPRWCCSGVGVFGWYCRELLRRAERTVMILHVERGHSKHNAVHIGWWRSVPSGWGSLVKLVRRGTVQTGCVLFGTPAPTIPTLDRLETSACRLLRTVRRRR